MKKNYKKPRVMFENLTFNTAIATGNCSMIISTNCNWVLPSASAGLPDCSQELKGVEDGYIYVDELGCKTTYICYHINAQGDGKLASGS